MNVSAINPALASAGLASGEHNAAPAPPPAAGSSVKIVSEFDDNGAPVARVVDTNSEEIICQVPPQQVLNVVTHLLELAQRREADHG